MFKCPPNKKMYFMDYYGVMNTQIAINSLNKPL